MGRELGQGGRLVDACNRAGIHGGVMERSVRGNVSMHKLWRRGSTQEHTAGRFTFSLHDHTIISVNALTENYASNISCPARTNRFSSYHSRGFITNMHLQQHFKLVTAGYLLAFQRGRNTFIFSI